MIANMSKEGKHISMDTLARICETLNCEITDVIELVPVSYTHLDVYKRQGIPHRIHCWKIRFRLLRQVSGYFSRYCQPCH